jgi:hypothetical protein
MSRGPFMVFLPILIFQLPVLDAARAAAAQIVTA